MTDSSQSTPAHPPLGHAGIDSLQVAVTKVVVARLLSLGVLPSPRRHLEISATLGERHQLFAFERGDWRVEAIAGAPSDVGLVEVLRRAPDGRMLPQDPPDGTPARSYICRGLDPSTGSHHYHYLQRVSHYSSGQRWDPSLSSPAEVAWRENGSVAWARRFVAGVPTDRGASIPALQSYWLCGALQAVRRATPAPSTPVYSEFYPEGSPAVEVFGHHLVVSYFPDGTGYARRDFSGPRGKLDIDRIHSALLPLDFDPEKRVPGTAFMDQLPDGRWHVQRDMLPENPASPSPWFPSPPPAIRPLPAPVSVHPPQPSLALPAIPRRMK